MNMNATLHAEQPMNMTILNYPGFPALPKGVRQMLLVSEAYFFNEPASHHPKQQVVAKRVNRGPRRLCGNSNAPGELRAGGAGLRARASAAAAAQLSRPEPG